MKNINRLSIFIDGKIFNYETSDSINENDTIITSNGEVVIVKMAFNNCFFDNDNSYNHYNCIGKYKSSNLVGVSQVKMITYNCGGDELVPNLEKQLNEFLNETKYTHEILDITYTQYYIAVKYRIRNDYDTIKSKACHESYQNNGSNVEYKFKGFTGKVVQNNIYF